MLDQIREEIRVVFERDPAARSVAEVLLCYPGFHAVLAHRVAHRLWLAGWLLAARWISHCSRFFTGIEIHPGATIGRRFFVDHGMGVVIGETAIIGDDCTLYHGVTLGGTTWEKVKRHPTLLDHVVVSAGAKVLGNITIGSHSRIGAGSVVIRDVPPHCTVVGIPGKVVMQNGVRVSSTETEFGDRLRLDHGNLPDPMFDAMRELRAEVEALRRQIAAAREGDTDTAVAAHRSGPNGPSGTSAPTGSRSHPPDSTRSTGTPPSGA